MAGSPSKDGRKPPAIRQVRSATDDEMFVYWTYVRLYCDLRARTSHLECLSEHFHWRTAL